MGGGCGRRRRAQPVARIDPGAVLDALALCIDQRVVGGTIVTELEAGCSARSAALCRADIRLGVLDHLVPVPLPRRAEGGARDVQAALVERGQHRSVGVADLPIAASAGIEALTVLHDDAEADVIGEVTRRPMAWADRRVASSMPETRSTTTAVGRVDRVARPVDARRWGWASVG